MNLSKLDIRQKILEIRTARDKAEFVAYFLKHDDQIPEFVNLFLKQEAYPYKEYSSWIFFHLCRSKEFDFQYLYPKLVDLLFECNDQTVLRNVVNAINELEITDYKESEFIDLLISFIQNHENKVALQVYSMYILSQFIRKYPELKDEISEIIEFNQRGKTAAYFSAKRNFHRILKNL